MSVNGMRYALIVSGVLAVALLSAACEPDRTADRDSEVLAWVEGTSITESDMEIAIRETFGPGFRDGDKKEVRAAMLESLIRARLISLEAERSLSEAAKEQVATQLRRKREELLMEAYIRQVAAPRAVTSAEMEEYYRAHPERFGAAQHRRYSVLFADGDLSSRDRRVALGLLERADQEENWAELAREAQQEGLLIAFHEGRLLDQAFPDDLADRFADQEVGEVSAVVMRDGRPYIARLDSVQDVPPRPFAEVRDDIRKRLAPVRIQEELERISDGLMEEAEVRYGSD